MHASLRKKKTMIITCALSICHAGSAQFESYYYKKKFNKIFPIGGITITRTHTNHSHKRIGPYIFWENNVKKKKK